MQPKYVGGGKTLCRHLRQLININIVICLKFVSFVLSPLKSCILFLNKGSQDCRDFMTKKTKKNPKNLDFRILKYPVTRFK